jgi:hypothetical protein
MEAKNVKTPKVSRRHSAVKILGAEKGFILIAALTLMATLLLVGATTYIVSSSNSKVGANYKTSQAALQVAMAGAEKAREALRLANISSANKSRFSEELLARVGANGALDGYTSATDDVTLASGTMTVGGTNYSYNAYLTNDSADGASSTTDNNGRAVITSVATGANNSKAIVQTTVQVYTFASSSPAVVYSKEDVDVQGATNLVINGADNCGTGTTLGTVYTYNPATTNTNGNPVLSSAPTAGNQNIDIDALVNSLKGGATVTLTSDKTSSGHVTYGSSTSPVIVYSDPLTDQNDGELKLNNVTGYGILLVRGNLEMAGNFNWNGLIIVTGQFKTTGGGSDAKNIKGQIYGGSSSKVGDTDISGSVNMQYDSCEVAKSLSSQPLQVVNWKQSL